MSRIAPLTMETASPAQREALQAAPALKLFRLMAHAPQVMAGFGAHGSALLFQTALDPAWRELVILVVAHTCQSEYEVQEHERIAAEVGCSREKILAVRDTDGLDAATCLSAQEKALFRFARQMVLVRSPDQSTFDEVASFLDEQRLVELAMCVSFYAAAATFIHTFEITPEEQGFSGGVSIARSPARDVTP